MFSLEQGGFLATIFTLGIGLSGIRTGYLLDRFSRMGVMLIGIAIYSVLTILSAFAFGIYDMALCPALTLPGNARVAVWIIVNVENWSPSGPMPRAVLPPPMGQPLLPDVPNWAWHEYEMRVGFWRFLDVPGARSLKATFAVNGTACTLHREACEALHQAGWEFRGHGFVQKPMHRVDDQRAAIAGTTEAIRELTGLHGVAVERRPVREAAHPSDGAVSCPVQPKVKAVRRTVADQPNERLREPGAPRRPGSIHKACNDKRAPHLATSDCYTAFPHARFRELLDAERAGFNKVRADPDFGLPRGRVTPARSICP